MANKKKDDRNPRGTQPRKKKKKSNPIRTVWKLVLVRGPREAYEIDEWVNSIMAWFRKTEEQARGIIQKAEEYAVAAKASDQEIDEEISPPVIVSCRSEEKAKQSRFNLASSMQDAIKIREEAVKKRGRRQTSRKKKDIRRRQELIDFIKDQERSGIGGSDFERWDRT